MRIVREDNVMPSRQEAEWLSNSVGANQVFGCQVFPEDTPATTIVFPGTRAVEVPASERWGVRLFAASHTSLKSFISEEAGICVYVWGIPSHPEVAPGGIPAWCARVVAEGHYSRFRELLGTFVVIIDQPKQRRITFVSDILGIRPMFIGRHNGRLVFGSDVWTLQKAGCTSGEVDYGAVSSWIVFGYNCTDGSLFTDLRRLPPGAVLVLQDGKVAEIPYAEFTQGSDLPSTEQAAEEMHEIVSKATKTLVATHSRLSLSLSGGFDSRYLLALALQAKAPVETIVNVSFTREEGEIAHEVARILGVPVQDFPVNGNLWDIYDDVYHFTADGFPISKFVTHCIAQRYPDVPMLNGFLGGIIIRGFDDTVDGKYETEWHEDPAHVLQRNFSLISVRFFRMKVFREDMAKRILVRSRLPLEELVQRGARMSKVVDLVNFYHKQRYHISNNFLQHLGLAEALLPFYSWELLAYKVAHPYRVFNDAVYAAIFQRHFPKLAHIPHSDWVRQARLKQRAHGLTRGLQDWWKGPQRVARCTRRWAQELLPIMRQNDWLNLLAKETCIPLAVLGRSSFPQGVSRNLVPIVEKMILSFQRFYLLEKRVRESGMHFDWWEI